MTVRAAIACIGILAFSACTDDEAPSNQERNTDNLGRLFTEVINTGRLELADQFITPDRPDHDPNLPPEWTRDREGFKLAIGSFRTAFPDLKFTSEFMVAEGDMVISYNRVEGTHQGLLNGTIPATGRKISITSSDICRFTE